MKRGWLLLAACVALRANCVIGGKAIDAETGKPLPHTRVFARGFGDVPAVLRVTNAEGAFCFEQLAPGTYEVVAEKAGYLVLVYGARPGGDDGIPFEVGAQTTTRPLSLRMIAGATIAGTALDSDGQPLQADVELSRKIWAKGWTTDRADSTRSGSDGAFHFSNLAPGAYYLSVSASKAEFFSVPLRHDVIETFYAASYTLAHATPIVVKAGQEISGLAVTSLPPAARRFSGSVPSEMLAAALANTAPLGLNEYVLNLNTQGSMVGHESVPILADGKFLVEDLVPAEYSFHISGFGLSASGTVDLTAGDVNGYLIDARPTMNLRASVRLEGREGPAVVPLLAICKDTDVVTTGTCEEPGVCKFGDLSPSLYRFKPQENRTFVKRILADGRPQPGPWLDLRHGAPGKIELVLSSKMAEIDGRLDLHESETRELAITVVAVDEIRSGGSLDYETTVADHTGDFGLSKLAPGKWRLFAIEDFYEGTWGSAELAGALREKSVGLELGEGGAGKVKLPVIGAAEWEAALRKAGM